VLLGEEMKKFPLDWLLLNRWLWITIFACCAVALGPFMVVFILLFLPDPVKILGVFGIIIGWGIAGGYKDWVQSRRKEKEFERKKY
jgi:hypothetical protein